MSHFDQYTSDYINPSEYAKAFRDRRDAANQEREAVAKDGEFKFADMIMRKMNLKNGRVQFSLRRFNRLYKKYTGRKFCAITVKKHCKSAYIQADGQHSDNYYSDVHIPMDVLDFIDYLRSGNACSVYFTSTSISFSF